MDVLSLRPGHESVRVLVVLNPTVDVIVARVPAQFSHVHPAFGLVGFLDQFICGDRDTVVNGHVFDTTADGQFVLARRQIHVKRLGDTPPPATQTAGQIGLAIARGVTLATELRANFDDFARLELGAIRLRYQAHHGRRRFV